MIRSIFQNSTYKIYGCMVSYADNYNPLANVNVGCEYPDYSNYVFIFDANEELVESHGLLTKAQFLLTYNIPDRIMNVFGDSLVQLNRATDTGVVAFIYSYPPFSENSISDIESFYPNLFFAPVGQNNGVEIEGEMSIVVTCGAGVTHNLTAYGDSLEFWDSESQGNLSQESSYSNATVASKLLKIKEERNCDWWEARYCARITADRNEPNRPANTIWHKLNGFGRINVTSAIAYNGTIPPDPFLNNGNVYLPFIP